MVGQWFKERFSLIKEDLANYQWEYKQWTQKVTAPSRRAYEYVINQDFRDGNVEFEGDLEEQAKPIYAKRKGYVVFYSGYKYEVRREIAMDFWLSNKDYTPDELIRAWMDKACKDALENVGLDYMESNWNRGGGSVSYKVESASGSELRSELSDYELNYINWTYTSEGRQIRNGYFRKDNL